MLEHRNEACKLTGSARGEHLERDNRERGVVASRKPPHRGIDRRTRAQDEGAALRLVGVPERLVQAKDRRAHGIVAGDATENEGSRQTSSTRDASGKKSIVSRCVSSRRVSPWTHASNKGA